MLKTETKRLAAVLDLTRRGLKCFPLRPGTKIPQIKRFTALATTDEAQIRKWFDVPDPPNIGYITDDLMVIDIDPRNGGAETWAALDTNHTPDTFTVRSAQGGTHLVFKRPEDGKVKSQAHVLGRGVDVKGRGGLAVGPGSVWCELEYKILRDLPVADAPADLIARVRLAQPKHKQAGERLVDEDPEAIECATHWMLNHAPEVFDGNRNNTAYVVAAELFDYGVSLDTALELMFEWNLVRCHPQLPIEGPDSITVATNSAMVNRVLPIGVKHPRIELAGFIKRDKTEGEAAGPRPRFEITWSTDITLNKSRRDLVKGILPKEGLAVLWGKWKSLKSFWLLDLLMHVALGWAYRGRKVVQGPVIYVILESPGGFYTRVLGWLQQFWPDKQAHRFGIISTPLNLVRDYAELITTIQAALGGVAPACVAIDTISRSIEGSDGDAADMTAYVRACDIMQKKLGGLICLVHHHGHNGARMRGFTGLPAAVDAELFCELKDDKKTHIATVKLRRDGGGEDEEIFSRVEEIEVGMDEDGERITTIVLHETTAEDQERAALGVEHYIEALRAAATEDAAEKGRKSVIGHKFSDEFAQEVYAKLFNDSGGVKTSSPDLHLTRGDKQHVSRILNKNAEAKRNFRKNEGNQWVVLKVKT